MNESFSWGLITIIGSYEAFKKFMGEFNQTAVWLKKYKDELISPSA